MTFYTFYTNFFLILESDEYDENPKKELIEAYKFIFRGYFKCVLSQENFEKILLYQGKFGLNINMQINKVNKYSFKKKINIFDI